jgi:hypothetical protein
MGARGWWRMGNFLIDLDGTLMHQHEPIARPAGAPDRLVLAGEQTLRFMAEHHAGSGIRWRC